jgi:hypothetical protein
MRETDPEPIAPRKIVSVTHHEKNYHPDQARRQGSKAEHKENRSFRLADTQEKANEPQISLNS